MPLDLQQKTFLSQKMKEYKRLGGGKYTPEAMKELRALKDSLLNTEPTPQPGQMMRNIMPSASQIEGEGFKPSAARVGMGVADILDIPKRALAYITGQGDMDDPEANIWAKPREIFRELMEYKAKQAGDKKDQYYMPNMSGRPGQMIETTKASQYELARQLGDQIFEIVGDPTLVGGLVKKLMKTPVKTFLKSGVEAPRKAAGAVARELTKIPEETLLKYASKEGRQELAKAYAKEPATAEALVRKLYTQKLPEENLVRTFINEADDIPINKVVNALEQAKNKIQFKKTNESTINQIKKVISDIKSQASQKRKIVDPRTGASRFEGGTMTADQYRKMRVEFDDILGDVYEKEGLTTAKKILKNARRQMKEDLITAAPEKYAEVMKEYARKLDAASDVKMMLGKDQEKALDRALNLLTGVERKGADFRKRRLQKYDDLYGTNFSKRGETMHEARQIAANPEPRGGGFEASLFPKVATGWGKLGAAVVGLGWPKYSGKILRGLDKVENAVKTVGYRLPAKIQKITEPMEVPQALALMMKPLSEEKIEKVNDLLDRMEKTKSEKMKNLYNRNVNKILEGK